MIDAVDAGWCTSNHSTGFFLLLLLAFRYRRLALHQECNYGARQAGAETVGFVSGEVVFVVALLCHCDSCRRHLDILFAFASHQIIILCELLL